MRTIQARRHIREEVADATLPKTYLGPDSYDEVIREDCDVYEAATGKLLAKFRRNAMDPGLPRLAYESWQKSIMSTGSRGAAAGGTKPRIRKDGSVSNFMVAPDVESGNVGYMDASSANQRNFCRLTNFGKYNFDQFKAGVPFAQEVDRFYRLLCPEHYDRQQRMAKATRNQWMIPNTVFTTITVNKNFRTAVHKDAGDFRDGMGNLLVHNDGSYDGGFFILPEFRIAFDNQPGDILFADVHRWHGNSEMTVRPGFDEVFRISYVLYYRENMFKCPLPSSQLHQKQMEGSWARLAPRHNY